jgi:hypothetical protein
VLVVKEKRLEFFVENCENKNHLKDLRPRRIREDNIHMRLTEKRWEVVKRIFFMWRCDPTWVMASFLRFLDHSQRRTTVSRTPLDE